MKYLANSLASLFAISCLGGLISCQTTPTTEQSSQGVDALERNELYVDTVEDEETEVVNASLGNP